jgi:hypothetical protein
MKIIKIVNLRQSNNFNINKKNKWFFLATIYIII